jgi:uncharacterized protein
MILKISNLSDGVHDFKFDEPVKKIDLSEPFTGNFLADVKLEKAHNQITLAVEITLNADFECDRCNIKYSTTLKNNYKMVYLFEKESAETGDTNISYLSSDTDKINIAVDLRDYAMLAIPMKKLCREDCKGLCPKCGKDLNESECKCDKDEIDSRWLPLVELKNKLNTN